VLCATAERATIRRILCVFRIFFPILCALSVCQFVAIALNSPKTENCAITICAAQKCASSLASKKKEKQKIRKLRQVAWWLLFWHTAKKDPEL